MNHNELLELISRKQPWHERLYYSILRLIDRVKAKPRELKRAVQRVKRGYNEVDVWNFDHYLSEVIAGAVKELKEISHGQPVYICDCDDYWQHKNCNGPEKWSAILDEIVAGFVDFKDALWWDPEEEAAQKIKRDRAFDLMKEHWGSLWD